jgi:hypothetical protein
MQASSAITKFWQLFERRHAALAQIESADDPVYDELLEQLQQIDEGLFFEFSAEPGDCELIITAEGDSDLFDLVDSIVDAAPPTDGWTFIALKPKLGFPETVQWDGYTVNVAEVRFESLSDPETGEFGLRLLVPGLTDEHAEDAHNALLRALDHALGERAFAETIQFTDVSPLETAKGKNIPLKDLKQFIEWRKQQLGL